MPVRLFRNLILTLIPPYKLQPYILRSAAAPANTNGSQNLTVLLKRHDRDNAKVSLASYNGLEFRVKKPLAHRVTELTRNSIFLFKIAQLLSFQAALGEFRGNWHTDGGDPFLAPNNKLGDTKCFILFYFSNLVRFFVEES